MRDNAAYEISEEEQQIRLSIRARRIFVTDVNPLKDNLSKKVPNPIPEGERGPSLGFNDRRAVTSDLHLLERLAAASGRIPGFLAAGPREILHFDPASVRVALVTAGGVCPGVNTVIDQIVRRHWLYTSKRPIWNSSGSSILGFTNGFRGLVDRTYVPLNPQLTESWPRRGGSILRQLREAKGSLPDPRKIVDTLRRFAINIFYIAGGDGSLQTAQAIKTIVTSDRLNIAVAHIPKTMDNDIPWISESFGFQTAIAEAARLVNAIRDEAQSNNRIGIVEVMGAGMGHTAAHTALASGEIDAVLIPEEGLLEIDKILDHIDRRALGPSGNGYAVILAGEKVTPELGLHDPANSSFVRRLEERFPMKGVANRVFVNRPMHYIRAVPANCQDQLYCRQLANCVVDCALAGYTGFSISKWLESYVMIPFSCNAGKKKHLPLSGMIWKQVMNLTGQPEFSGVE